MSYELADLVAELERRVDRPVFAYGGVLNTVREPHRTYVTGWKTGHCGSGVFYQWGLAGTRLVKGA